MNSGTWGFFATILWRPQHTSTDDSSATGPLLLVALSALSARAQPVPSRCPRLSRWAVRSGQLLEDRTSFAEELTGSRLAAVQRKKNTCSFGGLRTFEVHPRFQAATPFSGTIFLRSMVGTGTTGFQRHRSLPDFILQKEDKQGFSLVTATCELSARHLTALPLVGYWWKKGFTWLHLLPTKMMEEAQPIGPLTGGPSTGADRRIDRVRRSWPIWTARCCRCPAGFEWRGGASGGAVNTIALRSVRFSSGVDSGGVKKRKG